MPQESNMLGAKKTENRDFRTLVPTMDKFTPNVLY